MRRNTKLFQDALTGVYNRRYLNARLKHNLKKFIERKQAFAIVMIDIDHFKTINDTHGHDTGDKVLRDFTKFLMEWLRRSDRIIRYGGDEFMCMLPYTRRQNARFVFERILPHLPI